MPVDTLFPQLALMSKRAVDSREGKGKPMSKNTANASMRAGSWSVTETQQMAQRGRAENSPADASTQLASNQHPTEHPAAAAHIAPQPAPSTGTLYGYARVSSRDQNLARQLDALRHFGVARENTYTDKASGKDFERPAWHALMNMLAPGDVLVVKSIDRLGRNYEEILDEWRRIVKACGASVVVLDMPLLDTRERDGNVTAALISDIVLQLLSYVAQVERENIKQRQAEGIAAAKQRGVRFGRPKKPRPRIYARLRASYLAGNITRAQAAKQLRICPRTFDAWLREDAA